MTVNLTPNAIEMICNGEFQGDEVKPVVQVSDVKLLSAGQQNSSERYRMILSDGVHLQQGMLATQLNSLVHEGKLQKGSIVQLSQFVSQMIQNRKIIIIIGLNVILEKCDPIGEPKTYVQGGGTATGVPQARPSMPVQSSMDQPGNRQSYGAASLSNGPPPGSNINGRAPMQHPKADSGVSAQPYGSSFPSNSDSGRYGTTAGPPAYPKAEPGGPLAGNYSDQNRSFQNPKVEGGSRPPLNSYSRPVQPTYQQPPMYANRGPVAKNEAPARIIPIAALNPYQGRWTIKARVTSKKELRRFNGARGEGKVFSFELLDSDGGEIQVTCFNAAAEQFYDQIEAGKVYMISRGNLKPASKTFNRLQNDYEIHLESTSSVQPCFEDDSTIPRQQFHFRPISDIESMAKDTFVDVIGVVSSINLTGTIIKKDGTETMKRTLHLKDMSGRSVELTMWGNLCNAEGQQLQNICDSGIFPVLALKGGRVNEFNGKTVGTVFSTQLFIDPDFPEARRLKEWFDMEGKNTPAISISKDSTGMGKVDVRKTISQIKDERLGTSEKPDYIMVKATIAFIKLDSFCYTACPLMIGNGDRQCSKKVINNGDGQWRCDRCNSSVDECDYRYNLSCQIQDHTGVTWVTAFHEAAEVILGVSAKELYFLKYEEQDDDKFTDITRKALFTQYLFKLRVKEETYNDEQRVKSSVSTAEKLNFSSEARYLLEMMDKLSTEGPGADPGQAGSIVNSSINNVVYQNMGMKQASPSIMNSMGSSSTGRNFSAPANQVGQYGNQYSGGKEPAMMGTGVLLCCNSCGGTGHNAKNCPSVMSKPQVQPMGGFVNRGSSAGVGISGGGGGGGECYKCHQIGHWARDCPGSNNIESGGGGGGGGGGGYGGGGGGGGGGGECYKCHQSGHWARDCPGSNTGSSGYGSGGGGECYKCHQSGHWARDCPGSNTVSSGYGSGGVTGGYGGVSNQRVGGF